MAVGNVRQEKIHWALLKYRKAPITARRQCVR